MYNVAFLLAFVFATQALAAEVSRCGTDAFGNAICMDKDGVLTSAPAKPAGARAAGKAKANAASAGAAGESVSKDGRDEKEGRVRCGTDPFGNTVCR